MATKNVQKKDASGGGKRKNKGRAGCKTPRKTGKSTRRKS